MLMKRQGERVGIWMYLQPVFRRHVVFLVIAGLVIWLLLSLGYPWLASLLGVAILTRIGRDLVWYRVLARQWPITSELLDWEKIQQIAEQDEQIGSELESAT
jgi:cytochrome b subunit of formate dehydrogenase